jgi:hypothetical protein
MNPLLRVRKSSVVSKVGSVVQPTRPAAMNHMIDFDIVGRVLCRPSANARCGGYV